MFNSLLEWGTLQKILVSFFGISLWGALFLVMFTYICMGEFNKWKYQEDCKKISKDDYGRILSPTIVGAIVTSVLRYVGVDFVISFSVFVLTILVIIIMYGDITANASAAQWIAKAFLFLLTGLLIMFLAEYSYVPFVLYGTRKSIEEINNIVGLNFILSIPSTIIEYLILAAVIVKKSSSDEPNIFKPIIDNKIVLVITIILLFLDVAYMMGIVKLVVFEKVLDKYNLVHQVRCIVSSFLFPILNIAGLIWVIYLIDNKAKRKQKKVYDTLNSILNKIRTYTDKEDYSTIKWGLKEVSDDLKDVAKCLEGSTKRKNGEEYL